MPNNNHMKELLTSKKYARLVRILGYLLVALIIFLSGIFVGYHKAEFSGQFSNRYYNTFGKHPNSPFTMMGATDTDDLVSGHGATGKVISVNFPTIIVSDSNGVEKSILIDNSTVIRSARESVASTSVSVNDFIVVIGTPNQNGQIDARLIRIMPNMMSSRTSTSSYPMGSSTIGRPTHGMMLPQ